VRSRGSARRDFPDCIARRERRAVEALNVPRLFDLADEGRIDKATSHRGGLYGCLDEPDHHRADGHTLSRIKVRRESSLVSSNRENFPCHSSRRRFARSAASPALPAGPVSRDQDGAGAAEARKLLHSLGRR
jgi:hypothetical protein